MKIDEPVWITGMGAATPLGCELAEIEANLLAGRSGVSLVTRFPTDDYPSRIAAQLGAIPCPPGCDPGDSRHGLRWSNWPTGAASRPCATPACGARIASCASAWCSGSGPSGCCSGRPTTCAAARGSTIRSRTAIRRSSRPGASWASPGRPWHSRPPAPAATTPWRSAATGSGSGWSTSAWRGPATWPSRRSAWRPSAISARCRGGTPIRPPRRGPSTAAATASCWAREGWRSSWSGPAPPGGGRRTPTPRSPAAGPAATPTTT